MRRTTAILLTAALAAAGPAAAQSIEDWDASGDGTVDQEEWTAGINILGLFSEWDADGDGAIGEEDFARGLFMRFDTDGDAALTSGEWDDGIDGWYGEEEVELSFDAWDGNDDNALSQEEFVDAFQISDLYEDFAAEVGVAEPAAGLGEEQFAPALFDWFDADDDQGIVAGESAWFD